MCQNISTNKLTGKE